LGPEIRVLIRGEIPSVEIAFHDYFIGMMGLLSTASMAVSSKEFCKVFKSKNDSSESGTAVEAAGHVMEL
jgi:hypothetical protein